MIAFSRGAFALAVVGAAVSSALWLDCLAERAEGPLSANEWQVPRKLVTRETYVEFVTREGSPESIVHNPDHGQYGPRHALPTLAVYSYTGEERYGEAIKESLKAYDRWVQERVEKDGAHFSWEGPYLCGFHVQELRKRGLLSAEDEKWVRDMFIRLADNLSAWRPGDGLWRGSQHRAQGQGIARGLAAMWYPDCPKAQQWNDYFNAVWNDWWRYRDVGINDTGYFYGSLQRILCAAELMGRKEVFTDPGVKRFIWDRLLYEVTPDGAVVPYGAHGGWNSAVGNRIFALELAAAHSGDGRYRWVAHRLMNYLMARGENLRNHHHVHATNVEPIALASIVCDDTIRPVEPDASSRVLYRKEVLRLTNEQVQQKYPGYGGVDCNMDMSQKVMPHKLVLRSGWQPGDLYMLVEAFPRHDPLNPGAIVGLVDHGSAMAFMESEKFVSRENMVMIEDLSGEATYLGNPNHSGPKRLPTGYDGMEVEVREFSDHRLATHAALRVTNYMGYEAEHEREILFVKNRCALVRDSTTFNDAFRCRMGPVWNAQHVAPVGENWANAYFTEFRFQGALLYENPRWDLLVYHAPHADRRMEVTGREGLENATTLTRYVWEGNVRPGFRTQFAHLLLPHNPGVDAGQLARGIEVLRDEPDLLAVHMKAEEGRSEWLALNPEGAKIDASRRRGPAATSTLSTDARALYLDMREGRPVSVLALDGTFLRTNGKDLFSAGERTSFEKRY